MSLRQLMEEQLQSGLLQALLGRERRISGPNDAS